MKIVQFFLVNFFLRKVFFLILLSSCYSDNANIDSAVKVQRKIYYVGEAISVEISNPTSYQEKAWVGVFKATVSSTSEELIS